MGCGESQFCKNDRCLEMQAKCYNIMGEIEKKTKELSELKNTYESIYNDFNNLHQKCKAYRYEHENKQFINISSKDKELIKTTQQSNILLINSNKQIKNELDQKSNELENLKLLNNQLNRSNTKFKNELDQKSNELENLKLLNNQLNSSNTKFKNDLDEKSNELENLKCINEKHNAYFSSLSYSPTTSTKIYQKKSIDSSPLNIDLNTLMYSSVESNPIMRKRSNTSRDGSVNESINSHNTFHTQKSGRNSFRTSTTSSSTVVKSMFMNRLSQINKSSHRSEGVADSVKNEVDKDGVELLRRSSTQNSDTNFSKINSWEVSGTQGSPRVGVERGSVQDLRNKLSSKIANSADDMFHKFFDIAEKENL